MRARELHESYALDDFESMQAGHADSLAVAANIRPPETARRRDNPVREAHPEHIAGEYVSEKGPPVRHNSSMGNEAVIDIFSGAALAGTAVSPFPTAHPNGHARDRATGKLPSNCSRESRFFL